MIMPRTNVLEYYCQEYRGKCDAVVNMQNLSFELKELAHEHSDGKHQNRQVAALRRRHFLNALALSSEWDLAVPPRVEAFLPL